MRPDSNPICTERGRVAHIGASGLRRLRGVHASDSGLVDLLEMDLARAVHPTFPLDRRPGAGFAVLGIP